MSIKDGGPYHPCECECLGDGRIDGIQTSTSRFIHTGASLRDEFAKAAMQGMIRDSNITTTTIAKFSYEMADAMLAERERGR